MEKKSFFLSLKQPEGTVGRKVRLLFYMSMGKPLEKTGLKMTKPVYLRNLPRSLQSAQLARKTVCPPNNCYQMSFYFKDIWLSCANLRLPVWTNVDKAE